MWHDVPNRGRPVPIRHAEERRFGDVGLASAWQGDNAGLGADLGTTVRADMKAGANHWLQLPVARNADGSGRHRPRCWRASSIAPAITAQPLIVQTNPVPYLPATLDTGKATLMSRDHESTQRRGDRRNGDTGDRLVFLWRRHIRRAASRWRNCRCIFASKAASNAAKLYQVVYTAKGSVRARHRLRGVA